MPCCVRGKKCLTKNEGGRAQINLLEIEDTHTRHHNYDDVLYTYILFMECEICAFHILEEKN